MALSAVVEGEAGAVRAPGGRPRVVFRFTFSGDKVSEIEIVMDDELPHPEVSEVAISQVLDVLIDNAAHHGAGVVTVEATGVVSGVSLSVTDEGAGITDPARIFERRSSDARGHGIGLALARSVVEAEGGRLRLERSAPRPQFVIVLPANRPVRKAPQPAQVPA